MAIFLSNEDVQEILTMDLCIEAVEKAYNELGLGRAWNNPRLHTYGLNKRGATHFLKIFAGTVPELGYSALRIGSTLESEKIAYGSRREIGDRHLGWLLVFSVENGDLAAIIEDRYLQKMRVGAMTGIGAKYLARQDAESVAILGSGTQAGPQLMALCAVRGIKKIKVFSPNRDHRESFAKVMEKSLEVRVEPVESTQDVVRNSDIVVVATNSSEPVFRGEWIEEGTFISSIVNSDKFIKRRDLDDRTLGRASVIVVSTREQIINDDPQWLCEGLERGVVSWEKIWEIGELVCGKAPKRDNISEITLLKNNGLSVQFVGVGAALVEAAKKRNVGKDLPGYLFESPYRA